MTHEEAIRQDCAAIRALLEPPISRRDLDRIRRIAADIIAQAESEIAKEATL